MNGDETRPSHGRPRAKMRARRRSRTGQGRRTNVVGVRLSDDELAEFSSRARMLGITVPTFLVESASLGDAVTLAERRAVYGELAALRRMTEALAADVRRALGARSGEVSDAEAGLRELIARQAQVLDALVRVTR